MKTININQWIVTGIAFTFATIGGRLIVFDNLFLAVILGILLAAEAYFCIKLFISLSKGETL